ncbi:transposase [Candidatus Bathyarchaeota archaeon]|nr:transposase [Candidatus Bathyarchaeota archaeon]
MDSFKAYLLRDLYKDVEKLGDRFAEVEPLIDWEAFTPIIRDLYDNKTPQGGRPNVDEVVMVKMLVLQAWYGLSDPELERRRAPDDFMITYVDEKDQKVGIKFKKSVYQALPLHFWMFNRTIEHLQTAKEFVPLGAAVRPPYIKGSVEQAIWMKPFPTGSSEYRVSSFTCDILLLVGLIEYVYARNPESGKRVQGARWKGGPTSPPPCPPPELITPRQAFLRKHRSAIQSWIRENEAQVVEARNRYNWKGMSTLERVDERNRVSRAIINSRIRNRGAVDLETLDEVMAWGGFGRFPDRDAERVLEITSRALRLLDQWKIEQAAFSLLSVHGVGIARATKVLGLSDQETLAIYDSRVGYALRTLKHQGKRLIHIPPSRTSGRTGDIGMSNRVWAQDYQKLTWILEAFREYLGPRNIHFRLADVEMAVFMLGQ